jgi:hypothetical protein
MYNLFLFENRFKFKEKSITQVIYYDRYVPIYDYLWCLEWKFWNDKVFYKFNYLKNTIILFVYEIIWLKIKFTQIWNFYT